MEKLNRNVWVYDLETFSNVFTMIALNPDTEEIKKFVIWKNKNQIDDILIFLDTIRGMIGFNNIAFDCNIIEYILEKREKLLNFSGEKIAKLIYKEAQRVIGLEWSQVRNPTIQQLDLFKIWHLDNRAKMTSLKKLEIAMNFSNVRDMPYHHTEEIQTEEQVKEILDYNLNDVVATNEFYKKTLEKIDLRKQLIKQYGLQCLNYSDSKIGEELTLKLYSEHTKQYAGSVKKRRTYRNNFKFKDCIPSYIKFETKEFNELLEYLKNIEVTELKDSFHYEFEYGGMIYHLGTGGIHGAIKEGVYKSTEDRVIIDADVASLYPSLAVVNNFYPQHLGKEFCEVYSGLVKQRIDAKKNGDKVMADGLKLSANSVYGKSNSVYSWLCDPLYTLKTTLAGQLSLCMLSEMLHINIPNIQVLQINTDGITIIIDKDSVDTYYDICKKWEKLTNLELEYVNYKTMIMRDVNNYISISNDDKIKRKGVFKTHEEMRKDGEWHKAFNQGIIPIALSEYFINNIPVEDTIKNCKDIYMFCKSFNATHGWKAETVEIDEEDNELNIKAEQKTNRYYISNKGKVFRKIAKPLKPKYNTKIENITEDDLTVINSLVEKIKEQINICISLGVIESEIQAKLLLQVPENIYKVLNKNSRYLNYLYNVSSVEIEKNNELIIDCDMDWRVISVESDALITMFNQFEEKEFDKYDINYDYYIDECYKIIDMISHEKERRELEEKEKREKDRKERQKQAYLESCVNKQPTERRYLELRKEWMDGVFPEIKEFRPSPKRKSSNK